MSEGMGNIAVGMVDTATADMESKIDGVTADADAGVILQATYDINNDSAMVSLATSGISKEEANKAAAIRVLQG